MNPSASPALPASIPAVRQPLPIRTPSGDLAVLAIPGLGQFGSTAQENAGSFSRIRCLEIEPSELAMSGRPCPAERLQCRTAVAAAARKWTAQLLSVAGASPEPQPWPEDSQRPWFVTGHQPALFHPGVWIKNIIVSAAARANGGLGLNLIVDNDMAPAPAVRVPIDTQESPTYGSVPYDGPQASRPFEELRILHHGLFDSFGDRLREVLGRAGIDSLITEFWPAVLRAERRLENPAWAFAAGRAAIERQFGFGTLELPFSQVCELDCFRRFAAQILLDLPRFHATYNAVLAQYRTLNRIRSRTHPVPDLRRDGDWLEAPFWIWGAGETIRRRLMLRTAATGWELGDDSGETLVQGTTADSMPGALRELSQRGLRVRTRALTTTLFARLYLADLFVHGIGGAKYDEMTDEIIRRYFGTAPPAFATLSATVHLPLVGSQETIADVRRLQERLRSIEQHPEQYLDAVPGPAGEELIREFEELVAEQQAIRNGRLPTREGNWYAPTAGAKRYRRLQQIRRELGELTVETRRRLAAEREIVERRVMANGVLRNREYAICLYPADKLRSFFEHASDPVR